jgi:dTDP-4-dehydrorhamnose 3,5-epimerase
MREIQIIEGGFHKDERGTIKFINNFDFKDVRRMYMIAPADTLTIRAWQGHKKENKYFMVTHGSFTIGLVKIDNWETPSKTLMPTYYALSADNPCVLCVPGGYANGLKANSLNAQLMVFSSSSLEDAKDDEFRFDSDYWEFRT